MTRLFVRGLGANRAWSDRLGDVSLGGIGFEYPRAPDAEKFQVAFSVPGEARVRRALAEVVDYDPQRGSRDREDPFFVRLRFLAITDEDRLALARSLDSLIHL